MLSIKKENEFVRTEYLEKLSTYLMDNEEEVLRVKSNEIAFPITVKGIEEFIVITIKIPTGSHDGDSYDGYSMQEEYELKLKATAEKNKKKSEEKKRKIMKDEKFRAKQKELKEKELNK